jgi:hypothetical protein
MMPALLLPLVRFFVGRGASRILANVLAVALPVLVVGGAVVAGKIAYDRRVVAQAKVDAGQAGAAADAGAAALEETRRRAAQDAETDKTIADIEEEIRDAPDDVTANRAARCGVCRLRAYRDTQQCAAMRETGVCGGLAAADATR